MSWSPDRESLLRELVPEGHSYSVCAARVSVIDPHLGPVSRNAAIGKATRLGIAQTRVSRRATRTGVRKPYTYKSTSHRPRRTQKAGFASPAMRAIADLTRDAFQPGPDLVVPPNERRALLDLTEKCCRWPYGNGRPDDPFYFCGKTKVEGLPYCPFHSARAFQPAQPRRRAPEPAPAKVSETA